MYKLVFKNVLDFIIALIGFMLLSPIFLLVTIGLFFANNGKPFFFQTRPGKNEKLFKIVKFKTMNDKKDTSGNLLPDAERLTFLGGYIRKTSLDELPQLFNVLIGDMSLIGPRPLLPEYLSLYTERQTIRHHIKPGITGWAQINGRNAIEWNKKLEFDVWYVENLSFILDLQIMFLTLRKVINLEGINTPESVKSFIYKENE